MTRAPYDNKQNKKLGADYDSRMRDCYSKKIFEYVTLYTVGKENDDKIIYITMKHDSHIYH